MIHQQAPLNFDYQATTPCDPEVLEAMAPYWKDFWGNASSRQNTAGLYASAALSVTREKLASILKVKPERLIFTSGATEANNLALLGHARAKAIEFGKPGHLITVSTEHNSVLDPLRQLTREGFSLTELQPDSEGILSAEKLIQSFQNDTFLVSIMMANNEIGVLQPLAELSSLCRQKGVIFHTDAAQAFGQIDFDIDEIGIDLLTLSGHKIYGPKGIGALIIRENIPIHPLQWGGGQEQCLRPGTVPIPLAIGMGKAAELALETLNTRQKYLSSLRNKLWTDLKSEIPDLILNGSMEYRLPNNLNFTVPGVRGSQLQHSLRSNLICSSASACSNGAPSHVLRGIGRTLKESEASLRLSLGKETTISQVKSAINIIVKVVKDLKKDRLSL